MRVTLLVPFASAALLLAACGGQQPAAAARRDTTSACCDSAALANCCPDSVGTDSGGCAAPTIAVDTAADKAAPGECAS